MSFPLVGLKYACMPEVPDKFLWWGQWWLSTNLVLGFSLGQAKQYDLLKDLNSPLTFQFNL